MFIEGVTVCIDYADFLAEVLPRNRPLFDRFIVVTSFDDQETVEVAEDNNCIVVRTKSHKDNGASFNRGKAVNDGLAACRRTEWLCVVDSDIVLPNFRKCLKELGDMEPGTVFGIPRRMCQSYQEWLNYLKHHDPSIFPHEVQKPNHRVIPVGFFQLWKECGQQMNYPEEYPTSSDSDLVFSKQFPIHRHLDLECIHLSSVMYEHGTDYSGRVSPRWGV